MIAVAQGLVAVGWLVLGPPAAAGVTLVAARLLGTARGWIALAGAGLAGWTIGVLIAGALTSWEWSTIEMVGLSLLFGTLLTMVFAVGLDMLAPAGSLQPDAGRVVIRNPAATWRQALAPFGRYRELVGLARANGLTRRGLAASGDDRLAALGPGLRRTLEQAGGIFVKLGQVASTRSDLLPADLCDELAQLRSSAEPAPEDVMRPFVEAELGGAVESVFASFDWTPIASASIAQVYAASLPDGGEVVVKVQRPGLDLVVARDSAALIQVATVLERYTTLGLSVQPRDLVVEFVGGVQEELDFRVEAANAVAIAAATPPSTGVRVPAVYAELSTGRLLVEERIRGVSITNVEHLRQLGLDPSVLADRLVRVMVGHLFDTGTFHGDPHPGNVLVEDDGTIVLIDLGAVGHLGRRQRTVMTELMAGAALSDSAMVRAALDEAGMLDGGNTTGLDEALETFLARHVRPGGGIDSSLFEDLLEVLAGFGLRPPRWMAAIGRTMVTLEGTLRAIDPSFSLVDAAQELARSRAHAVPTPATLRATMESEAMSQIPRLRRIPQRIDEILGQAAKGRLRARVSLFSERDDIETMTRLVNRLVLGIVAAALGIGSVMLLGVRTGPVVTGSVTVNEVLGYIGLAISSILMLRLIAAIVRDGRV